MSGMRLWQELGPGYPGEDPLTRALFGVLAPWGGGDELFFPPPHENERRFRCPVYEWGHEETPTPKEVWELASQLAQAALRAGGRL